jgi:ATP-dependent DNA helicase RecQ
MLPDVPFLALTATATLKVVDDIQEKLRFRERNVLRGSFERKNLVYTVKQTEDKEKYLTQLLKRLPGSGIIYARSRKRTRELSEALRKEKISADYYHAGLSPESRSYKQNEWMAGHIRIIVATNAFGMGIDKPDVRFVIHIDMPDSIEAYFQEAGRAGRDHKTAHAVLLYSPADKSNVSRRIEMNYPEVDQIKQVYRSLGNFYQVPVGSGKNQSFDFNVAEFASRYKLSIMSIYSSLKFLQVEGYIELTDEIFNPSKIKFNVERKDLYQFQLSNVDFDAFIKLVLRTYTGVFTEFVTIYEESLARQANVQVELILQYLKRLNSMGIIRYLPQKKTPVIIYTEERLDIKNLHISKEHYRDRKTEYKSRLEAMMDYASGMHRCRSLYLLAYFGEKGNKRCGHCDVCMQEKDLQLTRFEMDYLEEKIRKALEEGPLLLDDLVRAVGGPEERNIKVIRHLLDNNIVQRLLDERLSWEG